MDTLMSDPHVAYTTPLDIAFMITGLVALVAVGVYRGVSWNFAKNDFMNKCFYLLIIFNGLSTAKVIFGGFMTVRDYNRFKWCIEVLQEHSNVTHLIHNRRTCYRHPTVPLPPRVSA